MLTCNSYLGSLWYLDTGEKLGYLNDSKYNFYKKYIINNNLFDWTY